MNIGIIGTNYHLSPLKDIESIYLNDQQRLAFLEAAKGYENLSEIVLLFTCNRVEIYLIANDLSGAFEWVKDWIASVKDISSDLVSSIVQETRGDDVITHLCKVSAGLESMIFGENEVLTQVKQAYELSSQNDNTDSLFNKIFQTAISVGKKARHQTDISKGVYSVTSLAIERIRDLFPDYDTKKILVVGAGTVGLRAIKKLTSLGHKKLYCSNRSEEKLKSIVKKYDVKKVPFENMSNYISDYEIIIFATKSTSFLLDREMVKSLNKKPDFIVDLGLPRNVDPEVAKEDLNLIDLDALEKIVSKNIEERKSCVPVIETIIAEEMERLMNWLNSKFRTDHAVQNQTR